MIRIIHEDGAFQWKCHNPTCPPQHSHVSHESVVWTAPDFVALPPCTSCGAQMSVKVVFSEEDLAAPNMLEYGMVPTPMTLPSAIDGKPIDVLIPAMKAVGPNPSVERHSKLKELLEQHGKSYVAPEDAVKTKKSKKTRHSSDPTNEASL